MEQHFLKKKQLFGVPIVPFETLEKEYEPKDHKVFVATTYTQLNRLRTRLCAESKARGYSLAAYVSPRAFVWRNVTLGEHCFIFENNVVQPFVHVGNNVVMWSGNHIGHHSVIKDNCFVSSHVVISGYCEIGENCFLGLNSCISQNLRVGRDCILGAGAVVVKDAEEGKVYVGNPAKPTGKSSHAAFKVPEAGL